ncbi:MAG: HAD family hydrolase [Bacillota bacterium]
MSDPHKKQKYRALLLDLDGTLLGLDLEKFIPAYIEVLSREFDGCIDRNEFARHLFEATNAMIQNQDPAKTNETAFYEEFCRLTGQAYENIKPVVDNFYQNVFPQLSGWGQQLPYTREVIDAAREKKLILVLATNPIFPAAATCERLSWSGLPVENFQLVTTMENMHFCKPNQEYYREISRLINCPPSECLMAGNDTLEDLSAAEVGMDTFLVEGYILDRTQKDPVYDYRGSLKDLALLVENLAETD